MVPRTQFDQKLKVDRMPRLAAFSGLLGPLVIAAGMLISALGYTGTEGQVYSLRNHFVSELGQLGVSQLALAFNLSLVLGGILNMIFLTALAFQVPGWPRYLTLLLGLGASLCGTLVGVFPMNDLEAHIIVSLGFFNLGMLAALLYSILFLLGRGGTFPRWLSLPGLLVSAAFLWFNNYPSDLESGVGFQEGMAGLLANRPDFIPLASIEWVVILGILGWFLTLASYLMLKPAGKVETGKMEVIGYK